MTNGFYYRLIYALTDVLSGCTKDKAKSNGMHINCVANNLKFGEKNVKNGEYKVRFQEWEGLIVIQ